MELQHLTEWHSAECHLANYRSKSLLHFICASLLSVIRPNLIFPNVILLCIISLCSMSFWFVVCHSDPAACHSALQHIILLYSISFCSTTYHSALKHVILLCSMSFCSKLVILLYSMSSCSCMSYFYAILM